MSDHAWDWIRTPQGVNYGRTCKNGRVVPEDVASVSIEIAAPGGMDMMLSIPTRSAGTNVTGRTAIEEGVCVVHPDRATTKMRNNEESTIPEGIWSFRIFPVI